MDSHLSALERTIETQKELIESLNAQVDNLNEIIRLKEIQTQCLDALLKVATSGSVTPKELEEMIAQAEKRHALKSGASLM